MSRNLLNFNKMMRMCLFFFIKDTEHASCIAEFQGTALPECQSQFSKTGQNFFSAVW